MTTNTERLAQALPYTREQLDKFCLDAIKSHSKSTLEAVICRLIVTAKHALAQHSAEQTAGPAILPLYADPYTHVIQHLNSNPYNLTKEECIELVKRLRAQSAHPAPSQERDKVDAGLYMNPDEMAEIEKLVSREVESKEQP